jgi:hypothetical protein
VERGQLGCGGGEVRSITDPVIFYQQFPIWLRRIAKSSGQGLDLAIQASKISTVILIQGIADFLHLALKSNAVIIGSSRL